MVLFCGVENEGDHFDRLPDCLDRMAFAVTAVIYVSRPYIGNFTVVIVLTAAGENIIRFRIALVGMQADLAAGMYGCVAEDPVRSKDFLQ